MNGEQHLLLGGAIGFFGYIIYRLSEKKPIDFIELVLFSIGGAIAGILPDIIEPAINPNHRSLFHSITALFILGEGNNLVWNQPDQALTKDQKVAISMLSAAYLSHLATDGLTKKGLPISL
jgi:membrane-bound metal-dependent hydrolase YbcI (DUF457 family)